MTDDTPPPSDKPARLFKRLNPPSKSARPNRSEQESQEGRSDAKRSRKPEFKRQGDKRQGNKRPSNRATNRSASKPAAKVIRAKVVPAREVALRLVLSVLNDKLTLDQAALEHREVLKALGDSNPRDRAFAMALAKALFRSWRRIEAVQSHLLERPFGERAQRSDLIMKLGLVQPAQVK